MRSGSLITNCNFHCYFELIRISLGETLNSILLMYAFNAIRSVFYSVSRLITTYRSIKKFKTQFVWIEYFFQSHTFVLFIFVLFMIGYSFFELLYALEVCALEFKSITRDGIPIFLLTVNYVIIFHIKFSFCVRQKIMHLSIISVK